MLGALDLPLASAFQDGVHGLSPGVGGEMGVSGGDANAALAELDQNLRCGRLGEVAEAAVRFPALFAKYPYPILINSAALKLADVFRQGPNFVRLCVLRVLQQSQRHLDKISSLDELVKRIFDVLRQNDPVARALTLRALGALASVIPERKQVHHNVRSALDSHDACELHAAIFAAGRFAAHSKSFAVNACDKISDMVRGYATPLDMKVKLMPIFQHMYHDAQTAAVVRSMCLDMLPSYPSESFTRVVIHTLTLLSAHTLVDVPDQVQLLVKYLEDDPRAVVRDRMAKDLRFLAKSQFAHLWTEANVASVIKYSSLCSEADLADKRDSELVACLDVLVNLVEVTSVDKLGLDDASAPVVGLCQSLCYSPKLPIACAATKLLCALAVACRKDMHHVDGMDVAGEAAMSIEALFLLLSSGDVKPASEPILRDCLKLAVSLCGVHQEASDQFVDIVGGLLSKTGNSRGGADAARLLLCQQLAALADMRSGVLKPLIPDIQATMAKVTEDLASASSDRRKVLHETALLLAVNLFQSYKNCLWAEDILTALEECLQRCDSWTRYRAGRSACRYGHHQLAAKLFNQVAEDVSSEQMFFWTRGLAKMCQGEARTNDGDDTDMIERSTQGVALVLKAITSVKGAVSQTTTMDFQVGYLKCRSLLLEAVGQLLLYCNSLRTSPPPAIAGAQARQANDDLQRCGRVTGLLRQAVSKFASVGAAYSELSETCFDADASTLAHLSLWQRICSCMGQWIEMVCLRGNLQGSIYRDSSVEFTPPNLDGPHEDFNVDIQDLVALGERLALIFRSLPVNSPPPICDAHTDCLYRASALLLATPLCYPRYFFQAMQKTTLRLAITPQARTSGEHVTVPVAQQFSVKVEGVVTVNGRRRVPGQPLLRRANTIRIIVSSSLSAPAKSLQQADVSQLSALSVQRLQRDVDPHNDFFSAQFLLSFPVPGSHVVVVDAHLVDDQSHVWRVSGATEAYHKVTLNVKAFDDGQQGGGRGATTPSGSFPRWRQGGGETS